MELLIITGVAITGALLLAASDLLHDDHRERLHWPDDSTDTFVLYDVDTGDIVTFVHCGDTLYDRDLGVDVDGWRQDLLTILNQRPRWCWQPVYARKLRREFRDR